jgi:hypothetical protein
LFPKAFYSVLTVNNNNNNNRTSAHVECESKGMRRVTGAISKPDST